MLNLCHYPIPIYIYNGVVSLTHCQKNIMRHLNSRRLIKSERLQALMTSKFAEDCDEVA